VPPHLHPNRLAAGRRRHDPRRPGGLGSPLLARSSRVRGRGDHSLDCVATVRRGVFPPPLLRSNLVDDRRPALEHFKLGKRWLSVSRRLADGEPNAPKTRYVIRQVPLSRGLAQQLWTQLATSEADGRLRDVDGRAARSLEAVRDRSRRRAAGGDRVAGWASYVPSLLRVDHVPPRRSEEGNSAAAGASLVGLHGRHIQAPGRRRSSRRDGSHGDGCASLPSQRLKAVVGRRSPVTEAPSASETGAVARERGCVAEGHSRLVEDAE
jgi:hypothetical protein